MDLEKCIDFYYGEYKSGLLSKKYDIKLGVYSSKLVGMGFEYYNNGLSKEVFSFEIICSEILKIYIDKINKAETLFIEYRGASIVKDKKSVVALPGMDNVERWLNLVEVTTQKYKQQQREKQQLELKRQEESHKAIIQIDEKAKKFYEKCYMFHVKETTPSYQLFANKNKIALIYIDQNKALNFLKIDGYSQEENNAVISHENIHYYEKAGSISYSTDIHGNYSSFGGSITGGNFSKLASVGGGLLFGTMGMAMGAALTYKPIKQTPMTTTFSLDSDIKRIDDRSVILNFYSETKRQYVDIELPQDIYNFLQTYLPEKRYGLVDELEKKSIINQSGGNVECSDFKQKIEKLKMMKEAGLLSDEKFREEQEKLLQMI